MGFRSPSVTKFSCEYKNDFPWVEADACPKKAFCSLCKKSIDISSMGKPALKSHDKSQKHQQLDRARKETLKIDLFVSQKDTNVPESVSKKQNRGKIY